MENKEFLIDCYNQFIEKLKNENVDPVYINDVKSLFLNINVRDVGQLYVEVGPMFSSKTTRATITASNYAVFNKKTLYVNFENDNRDTTGGDNKKFSCHNPSLIYLNDSVDTIKVKELENISEEYDCYILDECQFYSDLYEICLKLINLKKIIHVYGLCGTFNKQLFGEIYRLLPISDSFVKINSKCSLCNYNNDAPFTKRLTNSEEIISIGGDNEYMSTCRFHHSN